MKIMIWKMKNPSENSIFTIFDGIYFVFQFFIYAKFDDLF